MSLKHGTCRTYAEYPLTENQIKYLNAGLKRTKKSEEEQTK